MRTRRCRPLLVAARQVSGERRASLAAALLALAPQAARPEPLNVASASGEWTLSLAPLERSANGPTELVLRRAETEVWRRTLDLGVREQRVSDAGHVVGYGYSGERAIEVAQHDSGRVLRVFALAPDGATIVDEAHERGQLPAEVRTRYVGGWTPTATDCFLHAELGRFVVRVTNEELDGRPEEWWAYDLASGAVLFRERPKLRLALDPALLSVQDARAVPGTPFVLVQWLLHRNLDGATAERGSAFQLVDAEWRVVWSRESTTDERPKTDRLALGGLGAVLGPGAFEIPLDPRGRTRGRFEVRAADGGWSVTEVAKGR